MFEGVVAAAEVVKIVNTCRSAECPVVAVVDVAAVDGLAASGESAVFVAGSEEAFEVGARGVAVDGEDSAGDGVAEYPVPPGCATGQAPVPSAATAAGPNDAPGWAAALAVRTARACCVNRS